MRKTQVTVYLDADQTAVLDRSARAAKMSRSAYASRLIIENLVDPGPFWEERLKHLEARDMVIALGLRALMRERDPALLKEAEALFDARYGEGATRELFGEDEA